MRQNPYSISATIIRFEDDRFALLSSGSLGEFRWPMANLPETSQVGDSVFLTIQTEGMTKEDEYIRMRRLLEEMIN